MIINDIYKRVLDVDIFVTFLKSSEYLDMVLTSVRSRYRVKLSEVIKLDGFNDVLKYKGLITVYSLFTEKYVFYIENATYLPSKEVLELLSTSESYALVVGVKNYGIFDKLRRYENFNKQLKVDYLYSSRLTGEEFELLYKFTTDLEGVTPLPLDLYGRVKFGYLQEVSSVFKLLDDLKNGAKILTVDDLITCAGLGNLSVDSVVFSLITTTAGTPRGMKMYKKKTALKVKELIKRIGINNLQKQMFESLLAAYDIKILTLKGFLLEGLESRAKDVQGYNNPRLTYFERRRDKLEKVSLSRIVNLLYLLDNESVWYHEYQVIGYLEKCMLVKMKEKLRKNKVGGV